MSRIRICLAAVALAAIAVSGVDAKTLRWSSQGDIVTIDPHANNEALTNAFLSNVYETLVTRDKDLKVEPQLATSWSQPNPTTWRFKLRPNVKFHDGTPFTADDVVFSFAARARRHLELQALPRGREGGRRRSTTSRWTSITDGPTPVLVAAAHRSAHDAQGVVDEAQRASKPQDFKNKEETFASRNANGTGPFMLKSREADVKTVAVLNSNWWGKRDGNVDEIVYQPIKADATRLAALLSGEIDFVLDPPPQDIPRLQAGREDQGRRGQREPHHLLRHGPVPRRAAVLEREGQEPVQGQARARGLPARDRHRRDQDAGDARPLGPDRRRCSRRRSTAIRRSSTSACTYDRERAKKLLAEAGLPERLRGHARLPEQPLHQRREDLRGGRRRCSRRSASR